MTTSGGSQTSTPALERRTRHRQGVALLVIVLLGLGLRLGFIATLEERFYFDDEKVYTTIADNFAAGNRLIAGADRKVARMPLYPLFLAAVRGLVGEKLVYVRLIQAVLSVGACYLLYLLGKEFFRPAVGLWAAGLGAAYPFFIFLAGMLLTEALFIVLLLAVLLSLVRFLRTGCWRWAIVAGCVSGGAVLLRASFLLFLPFVAPVFVWAAGNRTRALKAIGLALALQLAALSPWVIRNWTVTDGRIVVTTLQTGWSLYEACGPGATGGPRMDDMPLPAGVENATEYQADRLLLREALRYVWGHPGKTLKLAAVKLGRFWNPLPNFSRYRTPLYMLMSMLSYGPLLLLVIWGGVVKRQNMKKWIILVMPLVYFMLLHMVFVGSIRYRIPAMAGVMVLAAVALEGIWRKCCVKFAKVPGAAAGGVT